MMLTICSGLLLYAIVVCLSMKIVARPLQRDFHQLSQKADRNQDNFLPPAAVILCVRGADPTLKFCLDGLLNQAYPDLEIHIVLDSDTDPAAEVVRSAISLDTDSAVKLHVLHSPGSQRGLKVSAILQALKTIPDRFRVIAFLDADTEPHPNWLRDLVRPLHAASVGATSGVRWFRPATRNSGSLIRAKWNLYAVALMRYFNILWGGSFAIRRDILEQSQLLERWSETICEDTCVGDTLARAGYGIQLVPEVSMVNQESTTIPGCLRFMSRQLVFTRLHSQNWVPILLLGMSLSLVSLLVPTSVVVTMMQGDWIACLISSGAMVVMLVGITHFEQQVAALTPPPTRYPGDETGEQSTKGLAAKLRKVSGNYVCQMSCVVMSGIAFARAAFTRQLEWRGITYSVRHSQVTLVKYTPFIPATDAETKLESLSI
jgi:cellulose synthase/poly-beta-1,6-N-acetylglucosamine synthase-like glycosyltransferase